MAFNERSLDDYVDVPERIAEFREKYADGSLQPANPKKPYTIETVTVTIQGETGWEQVAKTFIVYAAAAYRSPDDARPGIGMAWETVPGTTPYTRNSELMNAETSAWGRAIVAVLAADSKRGIATRSEIAARRAEQSQGQPLAPQNGDGPGAGAAPGAGVGAHGSNPPAGTPGPSSPTSTEAQALADAAKRVRSMNSLRTIHQQAVKGNLLNAPAAHPDTGQIGPLAAYLLERKAEFAAEPAREAG